jgi:predicted PurR-regulated permease PerM
MTPQESWPARDLTRTILGSLFIVALIVCTVWIVRPFLPAFVWATTIVITTWPILLRTQAWLGHGRRLATAAMTLGLLLIVLIPVSLSIAVVISNVNTIVVRLESLANVTVPPPPDWVDRIPVRGPALRAEWQKLSEQGPAALSGKLAPNVGRFLVWFAGKIGGIGAMLLQVLLTVIIAAVLYANGETAARGARRFAGRLAGPNGERAVMLAASTIRGVARGIVVTAIIQSLIAGLGFSIASVPAAGLFTAAAFIFCLAQIGPIPIMLPVVVWKFYTEDSGSGFILLVFTLVAGLIDNFIRPVLIRAGADLPLLLIIAGVIGGLISFGMLGLFIGPVILAVTWVLVREWVEGRPDSSKVEPSSSAASV